MHGEHGHARHPSDQGPASSMSARPILTQECFAQHAVLFLPNTQYPCFGPLSVLGNLCGSQREYEVTTHFIQEIASDQRDILWCYRSNLSWGPCRPADCLDCPFHQEECATPGPVKICCGTPVSFILFLLRATAARALLPHGGEGGRRPDEGARSGTESTCKSHGSMCYIADFLTG